MADVLPILLSILAQSAAGPAPPAQAAADQPREECPAPSSDSREITICAQRPQGYRLNPDILEAKRELRRGGAVPRAPGERRIPDGTMPGPPPPTGLGAVNLIAVGLTAAEMAKRLAEGKAVGSMFETDPHPDEYHLYLMAKARREAREQAEAEAKAGARAKAAAQPSASTATHQP
jgi:hypothetical protein